MDASVFPPPPYSSEGWHPHPGMPFRPEFPTTSNMMPFHPGMGPNDPMPNIEPGSHPLMIPPNGMFPPHGYGPINLPNGMQRFPVPANFAHQMSPGFPPNGISSPSVHEPTQSPFGLPDQGTNSASNTPLKNQNGNLPFSPNGQNGFDSAKPPPSRFLFTTDMANKAVQAVKLRQFESMASWHLANYPSTSQASVNGLNGAIGKDSTSSRGVKRKASSQPLDIQSLPFNSDMGMQNPGSANPDFNSQGHPFSNEPPTSNNDFMRPSSAKSDGVTTNENDPLRCIQRMTEQVDDAPASKISRTSSETLNDKNKRNNQNTNEKLRRLSEIESSLIKQVPMPDGQNQRLPPYYAGPFGARMAFMPGGPMPGMMGHQGSYDPQMMAAMQRPPYGSGMPPGPYPIGPNGVPILPGGMPGPRGMMPPNAMPGNFPPNMFPGPGSMPSPSFGSQMPPASSALPPMMPNMPFPPGSVASPGPMGEPGMPPPYHMAAPAGMMQQSPRFPVPGQGMPSMGPGGMVPPGMMPMGAMRPGFPGDMGMVRGPCPPDGFGGWSPHQMPQPLANLESRVPSAKVSYMPQK